MHKSNVIGTIVPSNPLKSQFFTPMLTNSTAPKRLFPQILSNVELHRPKGH
jgi:hypothetical protein